MNLNMIRPKNETEDLLISITKVWETLIEQTHRKAEETFEFKTIRSKETFHFVPPFLLREDWMLGLLDLKVYSSVFNKTEEFTKFNLYILPVQKSGSVSYEKARDEIEKDLDFSDITATDLQDEIVAPIFIKEFREQVTKRMKDFGYMTIFGGLY